VWRQRQQWAGCSQNLEETHHGRVPRRPACVDPSRLLV